MPAAALIASYTTVSTYTVALSVVSSVGALYSVEINLASSGDAWEDITDYTLKAQWSRDLADIDNPIEAGGATVMLDNTDRRFAPDNTGGPYSPGILPNRQMRIRATTTAGSLYPLFHGFIESISLKPDLGRQTATIDCNDRGIKLKENRIDMPLRANYNAGSLITEVLSFGGIASDQRSIDPSLDVINFAWFGDDPDPEAKDNKEGKKPARALAQVIEFGDYKAHVAGDGVVRVQHRYAGIAGNAQASYSEFKKFTWSYDGEDVGNIVEMASTPRVARSTVGSIGWIESPIPIPAVGHVSFWTEYVDTDDPREHNTPCQSVTVASHAASTRSGGGGTDLTSVVSIAMTAYGTTAVTTVYSPDSRAAWMNQYNLRGFALQKKPDLSFTTEDGSSQDVYGKRSVEFESDFFPTYEYLREYGRIQLDKRRGATTKVTATIENVYPDILANEVGHLIHITMSEVSAASLFTVMAVNHTINLTAGLEHSVEYDLRLWRDQRILILNHATRGQLDQNVLGF